MILFCVLYALFHLRVPECVEVQTGSGTFWQYSVIGGWSEIEVFFIDALVYMGQAKVLLWKESAQSMMNE